MGQQPEKVTGLVQPRGRARTSTWMNCLAGVAAEAADQGLAHGEGDEAALIDAGDEEVRGHALHVVGIVGAADRGIVERVAIARTQNDLAAEEGLELEDRQPERGARGRTALTLEFAT